jgi:hypothetical protein
MIFISPHNSSYIVLSKHRATAQELRTAVSRGVSPMDKSAAIELLPGTPVLFRGRLYSVTSVKSGVQSEAPFFRLRDLDNGAVTGLISYTMLEAAPEESAMEKP